MIFQFLDRLKGLTTDTLQDTKLSKALPYFVKRGSENVKVLAKGIVDRAAENTKKDTKGLSTTKAASKSTTPSQGSTAQSVANGKTTDMTSISRDAKSEPVATSTLKRPRVLDPVSAQSVKRQAVIAPASKVVVTSGATVPKRPLVTVGSKSSTTATMTKPKAGIPAIKSTSAFSASIKKAVPAPTKTSVPTRTATSTTSGFNFSGMMQQILDPKVVEAKEKPEEAALAETAEEKTKRLRKETRRKLRVSWKPDQDLCAIRVFTHDPDEETGHDASSVRDVNDVGNEGRMFKQLHKDHKEIIDVEMEEEEKEESFYLIDWEPPTETDFSDLNDPEVEWNKIYRPFARGELYPDSGERTIQQQREASTLMAVYITRDDIPSRPQSPTEIQNDTSVVPTNFGPPDETTRKREAKFIAPVPVNVDLDAIARILGANNQPVPQQAPQPVQVVAQPAAPPQLSQQDLFAALQQLTAQAPVPSQAPTAIIQHPVYPSAPEQNNSALNPMALASLFGSVQFPAVAPPAASAAPPTIDLSAMLSQLQSHSEQAIAPAPMSQVNSTMPNVGDLWAQLGLSQQFQQAAAYNGYAPTSQALQQPQQSETYQTSGHYENPDRKRFRETSDDDQTDSQWNKRPNPGQGAGRGGENFKKWDSQRKPKWNYDDNPKKFSLPCKFWPLGKCTKGSSCTYRHDV
jgi:hypothetical protein